MIKSKTFIKTKFEALDEPTQTDFSDLFDSVYFKLDDPIAAGNKADLVDGVVPPSQLPIVMSETEPSLIEVPIGGFWIDSSATQQIISGGNANTTIFTTIIDGGNA